tara:strand:- start:162 stop:341 length:180 start_codon:yes stop_codon:yes gene_type:complete
VLFSFSDEYFSSDYLSFFAKYLGLPLPNLEKIFDRNKNKKAHIKIRAILLKVYFFEFYF